MSKATPLDRAAPAADALFARIMSAIVQDCATGADWIQNSPGIAVRSIWNDRTVLLRCDAGAVIREHVHDREERFVVLNGVLRFGAACYAAGATIVSAPGSTHEAGEAVTDCLILVQQSD